MYLDLDSDDQFYHVSTHASGVLFWYAEMNSPRVAAGILRVFKMIGNQISEAGKRR